MRALAGTLAVLALIAGTAGARSAAAGSRPALYTAAQASVGNKAYTTNCSGCHGAMLEGGAGPALSGGTLRTLAKKTKLTVGDMYDFVSLQMPMNAPGTLSKPQYAAIIAYILKFNGYPAGSKALTSASAHGSTVIITSYRGT